MGQRNGKPLARFSEQKEPETGMKLVYTHVRRRGASAFETVRGPEKPSRDQRAFIKRIRQERGDSPYEEVMISQVILRRKIGKASVSEVKPKPKPEAKPMAKAVTALTGMAKRMLGK